MEDLQRNFIIRIFEGRVPTSWKEFDGAYGFLVMLQILLWLLREFDIVYLGAFKPRVTD